MTGTHPAGTAPPTTAGSSGGPASTVPGPGGARTQPRDAGSDPTTTTTTTSTSTTNPTVPDAFAAPPGDSGGVAAPVVGLLLVVTLVMGAVAGFLLRPRTGRGAPGDGRGAAAPARSGPPAEDRADRLAAAMVEIRDRLRNAALVDRIDGALADAGWSTLEPVGRPFDPAVHRAVDHQPTPSPALHRTVASVERVGFRDGSGRLLRPAEVVVYHHEPVAGPGGPP